MEYKFIICSWNANGISNKKPMLINFLQNQKVDIMLVNETKLTDQDTLKFQKYEVLRKDRHHNTRAGGVAILIRKGIPYVDITANDNLLDIEHITIKLEDNTYITSV